MTSHRFSSQFLVILATTLSSAPGFAEELMREKNLPNVAGLKPAGRVALFESPKELSWYLPLSLSSTLSCSPSGSSKRSCYLRVTNSLGESEAKALNARGVISLSPFDRSVVLSVRERFEGFSIDENVAETKLETLAMNEKGPYASLGFRAESKKVEAVESRYADGTLGARFVSEVELRAEAVGEYVEVRDPARLQSEMLALPRRMSRSELQNSLVALVRRLDLAVFDLDREAAEDRVRGDLLRHFFKINWRKSFDVQVEAVRAMGQRYVITDQTSEPFLLKYTTVLELKEGARSSTSCEGVE